MTQDLSVGIDVGSHKIKVVACGVTDSRDLPPIRGTGFAESSGLRHGHIVEPSRVTEQTEAAVQQASESAGRPIKTAHLAISGTSLSGRHAAGTIEFENDNHEITEGDVSEAVQAAESSLENQFSKNNIVLHRFPLAYKVDGRSTMSRPVGLKGSRLAVRTFFITALSQHVYDLVAAVEDSGITVSGVTAGPLAASTVTLTDAQKIAGCVLADIGSETVSVIVFDNNQPVSLAVFPIGSTDITNDIALGLKIPLEKAEQIKRGGITGKETSKDQLEDIISARLSDIFELIEEHLEKINRRGLLPAGIILTGGGSSLSMVEDTARSALDLPSEKASIKLPKTKIIRELQNSTWSVAYGTATYALRNQSTGLLSSVRSSGSVILDWFNQFLP